MKFFGKSILSAVAVVATAGMGSAFTLHGEYYDMSDVETLAQAISEIAGGPQLEFDTDKLDFGILPDNNIGTVDEFLESRTAIITNRVDNFTGVDDDGIDFGHDMGESLWRFTGTVQLVNNQEYTVTSDDGFSMVVDLDRDGDFDDETPITSFDGLQAPNLPKSGTFTGATGTYALEFFYFEGAKTQAQLVSDLVPGAPVPLPAGVWLLGTALAGFGVMSRRRRKAA